MRKIILLIFALSLSFLSIKAAIHYVPGDFPDIQAGIDAANNGDTVIVAPGVYFENINFKGKNIILASNFLLSQDMADIQNTIIDGSNPVHEDTASCVLFISGEDSTCVLKGFTITGGTGTDWEDEHNPGHYYTEGGGILIQYSSPTIQNNVIINNEAIHLFSHSESAGGGAIRCGDGNPVILNNIIMNNTSLYGAGIVLNYSGAKIKNNIIAYNSGGDDFGGGGIWSLDNGEQPIHIYNNTIVYNHSEKGGGGIRTWYSVVEIMNNILRGNTANYQEQIQGTFGVVTYCNVEGGFSGTGNIDEPAELGYPNFILESGSPCIDSGNPEDVYNDPEDPQNPANALYPAMGSLFNDMGAYGGPGSMMFPGLITSMQEFENDAAEIQISPNPVSKQRIMLHGNLDRIAKIHLIGSNSSKLFEVSNLFRGSIDLPPNISKGVYLLRIVYDDGRSQTKKLLII